MRLPALALIRAAALCCVLASAVPAAAQNVDYPSHQIRAVVPFPAGGINDTIGRLLFSILGEKLSANIVVENRPGAGGTIGTQNAANSPADGYTVLLGAASTIAVAPNLYKNPGYSVSKDFTAIGGIASVPSVLIVNAQSPYRQWKDLVAADKARPGSLTYGSAGSGTSHHVQAELLNIRAGTHFMHVPYKGGAPATKDLMGGLIDLMVDPLPTTLASVQGNRVRPLAITTEKRSPLLPDVPTLKELGVNYNASTWFGLFVPAGTPEPAVARLSEALQSALRDPALADNFKQRGIDPLPLARQDFDGYVKSENDIWAGVIKQAGIEVQ